MRLRKKIKQHREILEIIWEDKSWTRRSWIRGVCKQCKDGIFGEEELRDHFYERTCWRCRKNTAARETGSMYCLDCFGYEYGLDAYEYIENGFTVINEVSK